MLDKTWNPAQVEQKHYDQWEQGGYFKPRSDKDCADGGKSKSDNAYSIVVPPPNVTGALHMGHAHNLTLQDIIVRYYRMRGHDVLWLPGTDHAGIATQGLVERQLAERGEPDRRTLGRDEFIKRVWQWKAESGGTIVGQQRRLGASLDWSRERFTMDEGLSKAVLKVFVTLYNQGLIYKDKRLVNWCPKLETAISDLEVEQVETQGKLWHFKYPLADNPTQHITVATTRPETMLGDTGVAVHPDDERYTALVGKMCVQPLTGAEIPIVADEYADPEQGTGAVKITPAHDFNDFEVGKRCNLPAINVMTEQGKMNDEVPEKYRGMDRFVCRDAVVDDMEKLGLFAGADDHTHMVPHGDRGGVPVEPFLTDQWYVDAETLAKPAIKAVEDGKTKFFPENWDKTYYQWMRNIQPWCISRQLWWGHRIPAWYGDDGHVFVAESESDAIAQAQNHYGTETVNLTQDEDVLDTWFSSGLWAFSTLGWPDKTPDLQQFYKTSLLVTGFDIIFFWVARMMMLGIHFMDDVPFETVYVHALVRDEHGNKMSKSKGNVIDPLELIDQYGADALRFTLSSLATPGRDIRLSPARVEGYRNFTTKLWNASRFCEMNTAYPTADFDPSTLKHNTNRWIVTELVNAQRAVGKHIETYRFNDSAHTAYQFTRGVFCDWYLEFAKPLFNSDDADVVAETRATAGWVMQQILIMLHPTMPFVTEELWQHFGHKNGDLLIGQQWVDYDDSLIDQTAHAELDWVVRLITSVRSVRAEMNVPASAHVDLVFSNLGDTAQATLANQTALIKRLARVENITTGATTAPHGAIEFIHDESTVYLPIAGVVDLTAEQARLEKDIAKTTAEVTKLDKKLSNQGFVAKAPAHVVAENQKWLAEESEKLTRLNQALDRIKNLKS